MNGYNLRLLETYKVQKKWKNWNKIHGVYELFPENSIFDIES
jgi:hypothetical protein